jgi:SAM-dependent methyltransferase
MPDLDPGSLEVADCPMCGSSERVARYALLPYGVVRCARCGMHYLSPRLPEQVMLDLYRTGDYFEGREVGYDSYAEQEAALRATFRRVAKDLVKAGYAGGDLLEVGAGFGYLLETVRPDFRSVMGTEYAAAAAEAAQARGLDVRVGGLDAVPADRMFDCIVGAHVIEHVYDPRAFVGELMTRLRPGGRVILGTPDMGSAWRRLMGRRWPSFKVPEHVLYFDRPTLTALLIDAGFEDVRSFPYLHSFPLSLIFGKLGVRSASRRLGALGRLPVPLPATTLALSGRKPGDRSQG